MIWAMAALVIILMVLVAWGDLKLMLGFLALVVVVAVSLLLYDNWSDNRAAELIPLKEVDLEGFTLRPMSGAVYELTGRVLNRAAAHRLRKVAVRIEAQDCEVARPTACVTIGEITPWLHTDVPAGQARDIKEKIVFKDGRPEPMGKLQWEFEVVSTQGG